MSASVEHSLPAELPAFRESPADEGLPTPAARRAVERERLALAQTLHDSLCQSLSGLALVVALAERKAKQRDPELAGDLTELHGMVRTVCNDVHQLVEQLRTPTPPPSHPMQNA